jgi:Xaa-Pro aminopeptidase
MANDWAEVRYDLDKGENFRAIYNSPWYADAEYDKFTDAEFRRRHEHARKLMAREGFDALILTGSMNIYSMGSGVTWASGMQDDRGMCQYMVLPRDGEPTLVYPHPGCHIEAVRRMVSIDDVRGGEGGHFGRVVAARLEELGIGNGRIGVTVADRTGPEYMGVAAYQELVGCLPDAEFTFCPDLFHELTYRKSAEELRAMATAGELAIAAQEAVRRTAAAGKREHQLAAAATEAILDGGGRTFLMMIGSTSTADPKIVFPNPNPSRRMLADGDIILTEISASYLGYTAKIGHPIVVGTVPDHVTSFYSTVVRPGFEQIRSQLSAGTPLEDVQQAAAAFRENGAQSRPIVAHGIDLITAGPTVTTTGVRSSGFDSTLQSGMTMNIEITPITPDGTFGMFVSRTFAIEDGGVTELTPYSLDGVSIAGR